MNKLFIIGLGERGLVHAAIISLRQDIIIVGGYDHSITARDNSNITFPVFENLERGLHETQPDFVLIATQPQHRAELFASLIHSKSLKTIIAEKPLALSMSEAFKIKSYCIENNWDLHIVYQSRFCEEFIALKNAIDEKRLGELLFIKAACYGNLYNQGSHMIDLIRWLTPKDKIIWVDATGTNKQNKLAELTHIPADFKVDEEHPGHLWTSLMMRLESGMDVLLTCGILDKSPMPELGLWYQRRISVVGSKGTAHAHLASHYEEISLTPPYKRNIFTSKDKYLDSLKSFYEFVVNSDRQNAKVRAEHIDDYLITLATKQAGLISANSGEPIRVPVEINELGGLDQIVEQPLRSRTEIMPCISIIIPMETHREIGEKAVLSWTDHQLCDPKLYEVIVLFHSNQKELMNSIAKKVAQKTRLIMVDDAANEIELFHHGATLAQGRYLLFTESHCIAEAEAVQQSLNFFKIGSHQLFYPRTSAMCINKLSRLEHRLYNLGLSEFDKPDCWSNITMHAFGIGKEIYFEMGGFVYQYNRFALSLFGADLKRKGYRVGYAPGVGVEHMFVDNFAKLDQFYMECLTGEALFRFSAEKKYNYNSYFGNPNEWLDVQNYNPLISRMALTNCLNHTTLFRHFFNILINHKFTKQLLWIRYNVPRLIFKARIKLPFNNDETAWHSFYQYYERTMVWFRVKYGVLLKQKQNHNTTKKQTRYILAEMNEFDLYGFHNQEKHEDCFFRWSKPVSAIKLHLSSEHVKMRIKLLDAGRLLNHSLEFHCFIDKKPLRYVELNEARDEICLNLGGHFSANEEGSWLMIFARPLTSKIRRVLAKNSEKRSLGLPLREIILESLSDVNGEIA